MKTVQHRCFVIGIQRHCEWVTGCFHHSITDANTKCANKKHRRRACREIHNYSCDMSNKSKHQQSLHAENIAQGSSEYHGQCESVKCGTENPPELFVGKIELFPPNAFKT